MSSNASGSLDILEIDNAERMNRLAAEGISVAGLQELTVTTLLDHVLLALGGPAALSKAQEDLARQVSKLLDGAEQALPKLRQQRAAQVLGVGHGGNDHGS